MPPDEFDTLLIRDITAGYPGPGASPVARHHRPGHPVLWFALGCGVWLVDAILLWLFVWFLRHG
jgi:hypothetical protein